MSATVGSYSKVILLSASFGFLTCLAYNYYCYKRKRPAVAGGAHGEIHDVLIFAHDSTALQRSRHSRFQVSATMERLLHYLSAPRHSLDVCVYVMTNMDLVNAVLKLHYRGVNVRIITDADMAYSSSSYIGKFLKQGIPVRWMQSTNLLHHKFCLLDASAVGEVHTIPMVMTGSLNWTNQALYGNWENIVVTSQHYIVEQYKNEFERLWEMFSPVTNL